MMWMRKRSDSVDAVRLNRTMAPDAPAPDDKLDQAVLSKLDEMLDSKITSAIAKLEERIIDQVNHHQHEAGGALRQPDINTKPHMPQEDHKAIPMIIISDAGQDLDDEMTMILARYLVEQRLVDLVAVIATLTPAFDRARLCRGTLDCLGLHAVRVGIGSDGGDTEGQHESSFIEKARS